MQARSPDLVATMRNVLTHMPSRWFLVNINPGKVKVMTFILLYHRTSAPLVFDAYVAAEKGDASGLALMSLAYDRVFPSLMCWGDLASKAVSADYDSSRDYLAELDPPDATLGSPLGKLLWGSVRFGSWPILQLPDEYRKLRDSDVPTLLISGSIDPSSPAEFAETELLPHLSRGSHIVLSEMGHVDDTWRAPGEGLRLLLTSFYDTGVANDSLITHSPMDFHVKRGFPKLAKLALGAFVGGVVIVGGGLAWLVSSLLM
jgi:pimeloyl-ACP methyl ester carboxylesterase